LSYFRKPEIKSFVCTNFHVFEGNQITLRWKVSAHAIVYISQGLGFFRKKNETLHWASFSKPVLKLYAFNFVGFSKAELKLSIRQINKDKIAGTTARVQDLMEAKNFHFALAEEKFEVVSTEFELNLENVSNLEEEIKDNK